MGSLDPSLPTQSEVTQTTLFEALTQLLDEACQKYTDPADLVEFCAPRLNQLIQNEPAQVDALVQNLEWPKQDANSYTRRRLLEAPNGEWSIYTICWHPGQYTPVHDHGTWGVVGVLKGNLFEHQMACVFSDEEAEIYRLSPAGVTLLSKGAINTFVPEPDHIHRTGVPHTGLPTASIHLYGRVMTHYHAYDMAQETRARLDVE